MKRFKYGINGQTINAGLVGNLLPMSFTEVAPGDTINGVIKSQMYSATTQGLIANRAYYDAYAFYVPYRLLWDGFTDFITSGSGSVPKVTDKFYEVFEKQFVTDVNTGNYTKLVPWNRRAYNMIWNKFFKREDVADAGLDDNNVLSVSFRASDFHRSEPDHDQVTVSIDTSGASLDVDDIRGAFAVDQYHKLKQYYGDEYHDFLRALGVSTGWTVNDEPERLAIKSTSARYHITNATAEGTSIYVGDFGGKWTASNDLRIPRKFFPEHGIIVTVAAFKPEQFALTGTHPISCNELATDFWTPEWDMIKERLYPTSLWYGVAEGDQKLPNFEHMRKGLNMSAHGLNVTEVSAFAFQKDMTSTDDYKEHGDWSNVFQGSIGKIPSSASVDAQVGISAVTNLIRRSSVGTRTGAPLR